MFIKEISNIHLKATSNFEMADFFKTKDQGGLFSYIDKTIFDLFLPVINSPALNLGRYKVRADITEPNIFTILEKQGIYVELDLAHVMQICKRHIVDGETLLREDYQANVFCICNTDGILSKIDVWRFAGKDWWVTTRTFKILPAYLWQPHRCSFFMLNRPQHTITIPEKVQYQNN